MKILRFVLVLVLSASLGFAAYWRTEHDAALLAAAEARAADAYLRGVYVFCRMIGERAFYVPYDQAIQDCNAFVETARENDLEHSAYWNLGYAPAD